MDEWRGRWTNGPVDGQIDRQMDIINTWARVVEAITHEHYPFDNTQNFNLQIVRNMITAEMATNHKKVIVTILRDNWSQVMQLP